MGPGPGMDAIAGQPIPWWSVDANQPTSVRLDDAWDFPSGLCDELA